ncbi:MAG: cytochrome P450 [bacterium]|nr:cytochrome P450 [bacterium]
MRQVGEPSRSPASTMPTAATRRSSAASNSSSQGAPARPRQLARLRAAPELLPSAVKEILRWVLPVVHFARLVTQDTELGGVPIPAGDRVVLFYPSANRDTDVFPEPDGFDIARVPNDHLAFGGFGEHYCLGAHLARLQLQTNFRHILARLDDIELDGPPGRLRSGFGDRIKRLPIRCSARWTVLSPSCGDRCEPGDVRGQATILLCVTGQGEASP